jgi:uncharacterized protein YjiS (DUF1127 family)
MQEMAMMTDRELISDIGFTRSEITRVFDPTFAASRWVAQDHIGY